MSYDILAFDPSAVTDADFPAWWKQQSRWSEGHNYNDPTVTTPELQAFFAELTTTFPPMNGPDAPDDDALDADPDLEDRLVDYSVGTRLVYAAFPWSVAEQAAVRFLDLATAHGVAVADVSGDGSVYRP